MSQGLDAEDLGSERDVDEEVVYCRLPSVPTSAVCGNFLVSPLGTYM